VHNLRDYATGKQKSVDDYPYGGGSGMVMTIPPFAACIEKLKSEREYDEVIFMSPGRRNAEPEHSQPAIYQKKLLYFAAIIKG
jgi:tRNA (guanine37-N1)-methyltransferase